MSKKKKNKIDVEDALEILNLGYGFRVQKFNDYQIRMWHDETGAMWDWYHTTGSLCRFGDTGICRKVLILKEAEAVAQYINAFENDKMSTG